MSEKDKEKNDVHHFSGLVFVACMFIGAGVGLAFARPEVGGTIGMGVGFLLMGLIRIKGVKPAPVTLSLPKSFGNIFLTFLGVIVILAGLCTLFYPSFLYPYLVGFGLVVLGLLILFAGLTRYRKVT
ncbi:hypothetical protein DRO26_02115 [Candidatus Bathyarchaeota archaeon]|nr:MAG: hypothetical protein DRO26_02115 [Candidatus Bathyarchaeota archaeon]